MNEEFYNLKYKIGDDVYFFEKKAYRRHDHNIIYFVKGNIKYIKNCPLNNIPLYGVHPYSFTYDNDEDNGEYYDEPFEWDSIKFYEYELFKDFSEIENFLIQEVLKKCRKLKKPKFKVGEYVYFVEPDPYDDSYNILQGEIKSIIKSSINNDSEENSENKDFLFYYRITDSELISVHDNEGCNKIKEDRVFRNLDEIIKFFQKEMQIIWKKL